VLDLDPPSGRVVVEADHVRPAQGAELAAAGAGIGGGARPHGPVAGGEPGDIETLRRRVDDLLTDASRRQRGR
jgi:hypothetical protein